MMGGIKLLFETLLTARVSFLQAIGKIKDARKLLYVSNFATVIAYVLLMGQLGGAYGVMATFTVADLLSMALIYLQYVRKTRSWHVTVQELGVRGWHLYGLLRNGRATQRYQELFVSHDRLITLRDALRQRYPHMSISCSAGEKEAEDTAALIVDSSGRFFVQQPDCTPIYTGSAPNRPTAEEIAAHLNVESYVRNHYSAGIS